ncbi:MAG: TIM-barrel domain-containing protein [Brevefilum sp.]
MLDFLKLDFQPEANPEAIIQRGPVRFTVLTSRLIRLEYDPTQIFEDRPTQVVWYRDLSVPEFTSSVDDETIRIETEHLLLTYQIQDFGFYHRFLQIKLKDTGFIWNFGQENKTNLGGTVRTLDRIDGATPLNPGLVSRTGWSQLDDSGSLVFNEDGWLETRQAHPNAKDLYFFGYGQDYTTCIVDFQKLSGKIPLLPRFALGNWWSRYWEYQQDELINLIREFQHHEIPLSVCVVDMDWHITNTGNESSGWTGYSWDPNLFPNPQRFLDEIDVMGLKTALNLHPAAGVHPHEDRYEEMAKGLDIDPDTKTPIPFDIADPEFTKAYLDILHHPLEEMGVDFWWMDWQQGTRSTLEGLDPLFWLNHLHFYDLARDEEKRPFIFSRWAGLGGHRYPIGFSGDTYTSWETLQFQPFFTATAANVGFGWWSHDIGGHMGGVGDPELYLRWVQYGVFSPIFRLHATKNEYLERRPWGFNADTEIKAARAKRMRHALIPYLYTAAWVNHKEGILPIRPMYHLYPQESNAYLCPNQYTFGSELFAIPFTTPLDAHTRLSRQVVWLPEGDWFDFFSGEHYKGDGWLPLYGDLDRIPVFARAGAIVPLAPSSVSFGTPLPDALTVNIFPGADNAYTLYEDDGETLEHQKGACALTKFSLAWKENRVRFTIHPVEGEINLLSRERIYKLVFHAVEKPETVTILLNGEEKPLQWRYIEDAHQLVITDINLSVKGKLEVQIRSQRDLLHTGDRRKAVLETMLEAFALDAEVKKQFKQTLDTFLEDPTLLVNLADRMEGEVGLSNNYAN